MRPNVGITRKQSGKALSEEITYQPTYHEASIEDGSRLAKLLGKPQILVNSRHHQAVTQDLVANALVVAANSADEDIVEAVEAPGYSWIVGVQWHPERIEDDIRTSFDALFGDFIDAAERKSLS